MKLLHTNAFKIFFSWQSDIKVNKEIIKTGIEEAFATIRKDEGWTFEYDESTRNEPGSPEIPSTIFKKIEDCDIFIADITPVILKENKAYPNSNVLLELGYAFRCLGSERIIIVASHGDYKECNLPFDINHFRIGKFNNESKKCNLTFEISEAAKFILDNGKFQYVRFFNKTHLQQNLKTGKYLRNVFIEDMYLKEYLRYFVNPFFFYSKYYKETAKLYFDYYTQKGKLNGWPNFVFSMQDFPADASNFDFQQLQSIMDDISSYLELKKNELLDGYTRGEYAIRKIERKIESIRYFTSNVLMLTAKAGQGKTNFICDLVDHILIPHCIPFTYINGYEIDAHNVGSSLARMIYPEQEYSIGELLAYIERFCVQQKKFFLIIIDGLNENAESKQFCSNLQNLLKVLLQKEFVRVIMTCRTEYYNLHYSQLLSIFPRAIEIKSINHRLQDNQLNVLIENYCNSFHIQVDFDEYIKKQFGENLLVLRIFCEAYQNQKLGYVSHLQKEIFFTCYYKKMQQNLLSQFQQEGLLIEESDIEFFITTIVQLMVDKDSFVNVRMSDFLRVLSPEQKQIFYRFIDSNIIIKREIGNTLLNSDVINFTFDEFRDFIIAHYLVDVVMADSYERFVMLVNNFTDSKHVLFEGVSCFLYLYAKESANQQVLNLIRTMSWYKYVFINYIWDVREEMIDSDDIANMRDYLVQSPNLSYTIVYNDRWSVHRHKMNITILLDLLSHYDDNKLEIFMSEAWPNNKLWRSKDNEREHLLKQTELILNKNSFQDEDIHNIFEHLLYLAPFDSWASIIYHEYYDRFNPINQTQRVYTHTKSNKVKIFIEQL